ncbi:hypothetical protein M0R45_027554 [Rubus argutus]|uniref:Uncharacterized protein n=1 Tax=Rubus argutus TaxID=59490 RepID=A0AAW1X0N3_RUBAR
MGGFWCDGRGIKVERRRGIGGGLGSNLGLTTIGIANGGFLGSELQGGVAERKKRRTEQFDLTGLDSNGWALRVVCEKRRRGELGGVKWRCGGRGLGA